MLAHSRFCVGAGKQLLITNYVFLHCAISPALALRAAVCFAVWVLGDCLIFLVAFGWGV